MSATPEVQPFFDERTNTLSYLVFDAQTRDAVVIDPVLDFEPGGGALSTTSLERLADFIGAHQLKVHLALETHVHADHLSGSRWLRDRFGAQVAIGRGVTEVQAVFNARFGRGDAPADGHQFDLLLEHRQVLRAGALTLEALATPGHTPACMSFLVGDAVFTGDALFLDDVGVGRCDFPRGSAAALYESVTRQLFTLPEQTRVYVGHDYPPAGRTWSAATTVGEARRANVQLRAGQPLEDFVARRTARDRTLAPPRLLYPSLQVNLVAGALPPEDRHGWRAFVLPVTGPANSRDRDAVLPSPGP